MEAFHTLSSIIAPLPNDNVDTDQIIPAQFLKAVDKKGFGKNLFYRWRYLDDNYTPNPDFVLNQAVYDDAKILVSGDNFGCGSSREHAAWAIADAGFRVVIAGSFSGIFYNNALKNGIVPVVLEKKQRDFLLSLSVDDAIEVDLETQMVKANGQNMAFDINPTWKHKLLNGLDDIALTLTYEAEIAAYEEKRPAYL